jgi:hypothetical protein
VSFDRRVFVLLLALNALVMPLGVPYVRALTRHSAAPSMLDRMPLPLALLVLVGGQLLIALPCVAVGVSLGPRLGLRTPILSALVRRKHAGDADADAAAAAAPPVSASRIVREATLVGLVLGAVLLVLSLVPGLDLAEETRRLARLPEPPPAWAGVLASFTAGVTEETTMRFGLFTLLAGIIASAARGWNPIVPGVEPPRIAFLGANVAAALVFGVLHFSNAGVVGLPLTPLVVAGILLGNGLVGLACGWLYWKRGLEAAIVAHIAVDLVIHGLAPALLNHLGP